MSKSAAQRKEDLGEAKRKYARRPKAKLSLDDLAILYGLTKPAFVNLRKTVEGFPDPCDREGNAFFYPAFKAVSALLAYVERKEKAKAGQARAFSELVRLPAEEDNALEPLTAAEQLKAFELRRQLIQEELDQGTLHRADHCAAVSDRVFSLISRTFGAGLSNSLDPNGKWDAAVREAVDAAGENLTLRVFEEMKDMLTAGVVPQHADRGTSRPSRASGPGRAARAKGKARKG